MNKVIASVLSFSLLMGQINGVMAQTAAPNSQGSGEGCNAVGMAALGALAGALLGGKNNRLKGAAIGGGVAAAICVAYNYKTRQTRDAQQVTTEYIEKHDNQQPTQSVVSAYSTRFDPTDQIRAGQSSALDSTIAVVPGTDGVQPVVEEEITMFGPDGKQLRTMRKPANNGGQGGEFQTQFNFKMPEGVAQGVYSFKTAVYLNGQKVRDGAAQLQVV